MNHVVFNSMVWIGSVQRRFKIMLHMVICADNFLFHVIKDYLHSLCIEYKLEQYESDSQLMDLGFALQDYDAVFLDIDTEETDGIHVGQRIREYSSHTFFVVETSCIHGILDGYKIGADRCLLKNHILFMESIKETLDQIIKNKSIVSRHNFLEGETMLDIRNIIYIESNLHKLNYYIMENDENRIYSLYGKLNEIEHELPSEEFIRIHQSYLVNKSYMDGMERYQVRLVNGQKLPISKNRFLDVRGKYFQ